MRPRERRLWSDFLHVKGQTCLFTKDALPEPKKRRRPGTVKPLEPLETPIRRMICQALNYHPLVAWAEISNAGAGRFLLQDGTAGQFVRYGEPGQSDITGQMKDGRRLAIEVKRRPGLKATPAQQAYLDRVRSANGVAGVASSIEEAKAIVEERPTV